TVHGGPSEEYDRSVTALFVTRSPCTPRRSNFRMLRMSYKLHLFTRPPNPHIKPGLSDIQLELCDDEIIVSLPVTKYAVTYFKTPNSTQLIAKNFPCEDDGRAEQTQAEFLATAWCQANDKARELRWIMQKKSPLTGTRGT